MYILYCTTIFAIILALAAWAFILWQYNNSSYRQVTGNSFLAVLFDKGRYGEYLTYRYLSAYEKQGAKFLFNCYLPRENGETTEIDVLMISRSGIYVFESKNYSGWIFGDAKGKNWTQTLPQGRKSHKEHFLNPVKQNQLHIKWLKQYFQDETVPIHSVVVFSERCTLKKVDVSGSDATVVKRDRLYRTVAGMEAGMPLVLDENKIKLLYERLYPDTQVDDQVKKNHIENIENRVHEKEYSEKTVESGEASEGFGGEEQVMCPRCGAPMVLRTVKKGSNAGKRFYGCSTYPKCRGIAEYQERT